MDNVKMQDQTLQQIQAQLEAKLKPEDQDAYRRIVVAGMKIMFGDKTFADVMKSFDPQRPEESIARGVLGLGKMLWSRSKGTMPLSALIPALTTQYFIEAFMKSAGLDEQRMKQIQQKTMQHVAQQKGGAA